MTLLHNYRIRIPSFDYTDFREALPHVEIVLRNYGVARDPDIVYQQYDAYLTDEDRTFIKLRFPDMPYWRIGV